MTGAGTRPRRKQWKAWQLRRQDWTEAPELLTVNQCLEWEEKQTEKAIIATDDLEHFGLLSQGALPNGANITSVARCRDKNEEELKAVRATAEHSKRRQCPGHLEWQPADVQMHYCKLRRGGPSFKDHSGDHCRGAQGGVDKGAQIQNHEMARTEYSYVDQDHRGPCSGNGKVVRVHRM